MRLLHLQRKVLGELDSVQRFSFSAWRWTKRIALLRIPVSRVGAYSLLGFVAAGLALLQDFPAHPLPGIAIALLAPVAVVVAVMTDRLTPWEKVGWIFVAFLLFFVETRVLYTDRAEQNAIFTATRNAENTSFRQIANSLKETISENQRQFKATMSQSNKVLAENTGGESFCYVGIAGEGPNQLVAFIVQMGRYPLFQVNGRIVDGDLFEALLKSGGDLDAASRGFSTIDVLTRAPLWHPLATYPFPAEAESRSFNIFLYARNGAFTESVRVRRLKPVGFTMATIVVGSYFTNERGIVFEKVDKNFPREILETDKDWQNILKLKRIKILE